MVRQEIRLDVTPGGVKPVIHISQYDEGSRTLSFLLFNGSGELAIPAGAEASIRGTKPDGNGFSYNAELTGSTVTADVTGQMSAVAGETVCELVIKNAGKELVSASFILRVKRAALDKDTVKSASEIRELIEVVDRTDELISAANRIERTSAEISQITTNAESVARQALTKATSAEMETAEIGNALDILRNDSQTMSQALDGKIDDAYVEEGYLYLTSNGEIVAGPLGPFSGNGTGGGGGESNNAVLSLRNESGWLSKTVAKGASCPIHVFWSSTEDDLSTGNGTLRVTVGGAVKATLDVAQGDVTVEVGEYLSNGGNSVKLRLTDAYGNARTLAYSITAVSLSISTSIDPDTVYSGDITYPFTPVGNVNKTVHLLVDGEERDTRETAISGRQLSFLITGLTHGAHSLECYFDSEINGETVESNHLYCEVVVAQAGKNTPIIVTNTARLEVVQYAQGQIDFMVYDPTVLTAQVEISHGGVVVSHQTVDRTRHSYSFTASSVGSQEIVIRCGEVSRIITATVVESAIKPQTSEEALALHLESRGRSNADDNREEWNFGGVEASLTDFNFASNGWVTDPDGNTALRLSGAARVQIPYEIFGSDFRTTGKTIELEFAARQVRNYDTTILSCISGGRGIVITPQKATLTSEQSMIFTQFKEDEHVRLSFVVEKRSANRLVLCYINGIMSGAIQYPAGDDFSQKTPVGITIGSDQADVDIYCIRVYDTDLSRSQILDNWIGDTADGSLIAKRYTRNDVYDAYGMIVKEKLPKDLPYLILEGPELPQYKGDKKTVSGSYTDPLDGRRSFTFEGASINVQGTSSQYYARKNYKVSFKGGFELSSGHSDAYPLCDGAIPTDTFTFKADVASSEGANNVELARLYNDTCPYRTPAQKRDERVRQAIDGFPIVIFWNNGTEVTFLGKYNFNNDKGTEEVFGFEEGDESWEIRNNTSDRVLWKSDDYTGDAWLSDFEGRYPDGNEDPTNLQQLASWLKSTDTTQATGDDLEEPVTYGGETFTSDTAEYRLAKFKAELSDHLEKDAVIFYYLFTELFLMVDSRAKNAFPTMMGGSKWFSLPYDFDTAIGTNNEGSLVFSYNLEDIDQTESGADVFNGQQSVLWINLWAAFYDDIAKMYRDLRSKGKLSYAKVEQMFEEHQGKWPEAIFNEDAFFKYIQPLIDEGTGSYLPMLQGSKTEQRKWWLYNRFRYIDSKYNAGDALSDLIQLRGYAKADITVTPYADIYPSVKYGSYLVQARGARGNGTTLRCPLDNVNDTEIYIYSASQLADVGDLSGLMVGFADFSKATKLQALKIGDQATTYTNSNLTDLTLGNNTLLATLDVRNCPALTGSIDLSGCTGLKEAYFEGTSISGVSLPNGGALEVLHLPETVTSLVLLNMTGLSDVDVAGDGANITTLRLENTSQAVDSWTLLHTISEGSRVRLIGVSWEITDDTDLTELGELLDTMRGLDEQGGNMDTAQVSGTVHAELLSGAVIALAHEKYPHLALEADHTTSVLRYYNYDGSSLLKEETIRDGGNGTYSSRPSRSSTAQYSYTFAGWSLTPDGDADPDAIKHVVGDRKVYAAYTKTVRTYTVKFYNEGTVIQTVNNVPYGSGAEYTGTTPAHLTEPDDNEFLGWDPVPTQITGDTNCYAQYRFTGVLTRKLLDKSLAGIVENTLADKVGKYAFVYCRNLKGISLPAATSVEASAFYYCRNLKSANIPEVTSISESAFSQCGELESIDLPKATAIGSYAFYYCKELNRINAPVATSIGGYAFCSNFKLPGISLPSATSIGNLAFDYCSLLAEVDLPEVTQIGESAFRNCVKLEKIKLPKATIILDSAFNGCNSLKEVDLYVGEKLGNNLGGAYGVFNGLKEGARIIIRNTNTVARLMSPHQDSSEFRKGLIPVYVPDDLVDSYKAASNWSNIANAIHGLSELTE